MSAADEPDTIAEARAEVERTREELGDTVEALAYKADVKARAHDKVDEVRAQAAEKVDEITTQLGDTTEGVRAKAAETVGRAGAADARSIPPAAIVGIAFAGLFALVFAMRRRG